MDDEHVQKMIDQQADILDKYVQRAENAETKLAKIASMSLDAPVNYTKQFIFCALMIASAIAITITDIILPEIDFPYVGLFLAFMGGFHCATGIWALGTVRRRKASGMVF